MQDLIVSRLLNIVSSKCLIPEHQAIKHGVLRALATAQNGAGNRAVDVTPVCRAKCAAWQADVKFRVSTGCVGQEPLPLRVVEAWIGVAVTVENVTLRVVVELDPQAVEPDVLKEIHHFISVVEGALGSPSDDIVPPGRLDVAPKSFDHPSVAFIASCGER